MIIERIFARLALLANLAACLCAASCASEGTPSPDQLINIGTHRLEMHVEGKGAPAVVIDAGISDSLDKLRPLQERLARSTRVVTYNRAGYGRSEAGPVPRHCVREAEELKSLLDKASVPGPYVLVGHSLGGLNMQVFASQYPRKVAGMILLDPPPLSFLLRREYEDLGAMAEKMTAEWQAIADSSAKSANAGEKAKSVFFKMIASEHGEMFGESARLADAISTFGDMPLMVIAAGKPNPNFGAGAEEYQRYWVEQSRALTKKSTKGKFILAEESTHYLYLDVPDFVAENILAVVNEVRAKVQDDEGIAPGKSDSEAAKRHLECFEIVWKTLNDKYFDPTFGGANWKEVHARYRPLIAAAADEKAFYEIINKMVFELNVSHSGVVPPDEKEQIEPIASAEGSLGMSLRLLDGAAVVTSVMPDSPGERMGLRPGFIVERIGGKTPAQWGEEVERIPPLHERNERKRVTSKILEQLYGKPGTPISLVYRDAGGMTREARAEMTPRGGKQVSSDARWPPFYVEFESKRLGDIGYIRFNAFLPPVHERFAEVIGSFRDARGLIIDLRGNHGGQFFVRKPVVDRLVPERRLFWSYKGRSSARNVFAEPAKSVYAGPLVVLVDVMSASSAEEVAGGLQSIGRAYVVGERTAGICVVMDAVLLPNGAVFVYPVEQTRTADGTVLEGRGVIPDQEVGLDRTLLLKGIDSQLEAAIQHIQAKPLNR